jgi:membrane protease YdiL (CAAX protease family)
MTEETAGPQPPKQVASWKHLLGFLAIMGGVMAFGFYAQNAGGGGADNGQLASHGHAIQIYLSALLMDWALLYYCWAGVHRHGGNLETLSGGRWRAWRDVVADVGIAAPFWVVWEATAYGVHKLLDAAPLVSGPAKTVDSLLPHSLVEILIWIAVSLTAGVCEELAFRGYLQKQLHALTGGMVWAVLLQALVFGVAHSYQGWRQAVVISAVAILFGVLAAWRRNLRANMIAHAWTDIWEGWLKFLVFR